MAAQKTSGKTKTNAKVKHIERTIFKSEEPYKEIQRTPSITDIKQPKS